MKDNTGVIDCVKKDASVEATLKLITCTLFTITREYINNDILKQLLIIIITVETKQTAQCNTLSTIDIDLTPQALNKGHLH